MTKYFLLPALLFAVLVTAPPSAAQDMADDMAAPAGTPTVFDAPDVVERYQQTITADDLAAHLYFFASDFFEGRETSTAGQKMAAQYLAAQYRKMGLAPAGTAEITNSRDPNAYMQPFTLHGSRFTGSTLSASVDGEAVSSTYGSASTDGHHFLMFGSGTDVTGPVVFAGYGISDDELGYNDYAALKGAGIDIGGKWLMYLEDEPLSDAETSLLTEDGEPSTWTTGRFNKLRSMMQSGSMPKGVLIVSDTSPRTDQSVSDRAMQRAAGLGGVGSLSLEPQDGEGGGQLGPVMVISKEFADQLLESSGTSIDELQAAINSSRDPSVFELGNVTVTATTQNELYETQSENVVAFIEGSDPELRDEFVVLSSHYDHIGVESGEGDVINNGADDDGSGTVSILEIAEAFEQARRDGYGPRRSVVFLNVTGEEKGLLGSAYYTDYEPVFPLEQTVTNLNIDMIGRIDPTHPGPDSDYVYIIGSNLISQELHDINMQMNDVLATNLDLNERFNSKDDPNQFYRRSDHWNFGKNSIPFIFYFTGTHEDYHGVDDEPDKIEYERMARIAQLIFGTAWQVANQDNPPAVTGEGFN